METEKSVFYFGRTNVIRYGRPPPGALTFDPMDDASFAGYMMAPCALAELLRRRPDPAKARKAAEEASDALIKEYNGFLDEYRGMKAEIERLRQMLRDPAHLRAVLARVDAKAAEIATLKARLAELETE